MIPTHLRLHFYPGNIGNAVWGRRVVVTHLVTKYLHQEFAPASLRFVQMGWQRFYGRKPNKNSGVERFQR